MSSTAPISLSDTQRRTLLNLWCRVARADGVVAEEELVRLSKLFFRLAEDVVSAAEVDLWLEEGPPAVEELLPRELTELFLEHAHEIIMADQKVAPSEWAAVNHLLATYFRAS